MSDTPLTVCCAWCQAEGKGPPSGPFQTHTICPEHMAAELSKLEPKVLPDVDLEPIEAIYSQR